jgi:hypothetical protein
MSIFDVLRSSISGTFSGASGASMILAGSSGKKAGTGGDPAQKIQQILNTAKLDANRQQIMSAASLRIRGIAQGLVEPKEIWEKTAGFLTLTGQPFTYSVDQSGQVEVQPQSTDDLSFVTPGQRTFMRKALERLDEVRIAVDTVNTKANLRNKLSGAVDRIKELQQFSPPQEQWERDFNLYRKLGQPVMIGLTSSGDLKAIDQLNSNFDYVEDPTKRAILQNASRDLKNILSGAKSATENWHYAALGNKVEGDDYYLDVDQNNEVVVRRNTERRSVSTTQPAYQQTGTADYHIIPEFLKATREDQNIFKADWERQAAEHIQNKTPFHLELVGGFVTVRATDYTSARRQDLLDFTSGRTKIAQATINLLT